MELVQDQTISGESVELDDKQFRDCTLVDCVLNYSGGAVTFERTHLRGCRYVFFGAARGTVHFLQNVGLMSHIPSEWAELSEHVN